MACSPGVKPWRLSLIATPCSAAESVAGPTLFPCPFSSFTVTGFAFGIFASAAVIATNNAATTMLAFRVMAFICQSFVYLPWRKAQSIKPGQGFPAAIVNDFSVKPRSVARGPYNREGFEASPQTAVFRERVHVSPAWDHHYRDPSLRFGVSEK